MSEHVLPPLLTEERCTDDELRALWREFGGSFHGPKVETGTMPEADLLPFLRALASRKPREGEALTDTYVQQVPDKCDRIIWRGRYYGLPLSPADVPSADGWCNTCGNGRLVMAPDATGWCDCPDCTGRVAASDIKEPKP